MSSAYIPPEEFQKVVALHNSGDHSRCRDVNPNTGKGCKLKAQWQAAQTEAPVDQEPPQTATPPAPDHSALEALEARVEDLENGWPDPPDLTEDEAFRLGDRIDQLGLGHKMHLHYINDLRARVEDLTEQVTKWKHLAYPETVAKNSLFADVNAAGARFGALKCPTPEIQYLANAAVKAVAGEFLTAEDCSGDGLACYWVDVRDGIKLTKDQIESQTEKLRARLRSRVTAPAPDRTQSPGPGPSDTEESAEPDIGAYSV